MTKTITKTTLHMLARKRLSLAGFNLRVVANVDGLRMKMNYSKLLLNKMEPKTGLL